MREVGLILGEVEVLLFSDLILTFPMGGFSNVTSHDVKVPGHHDVMSLAVSIWIFNVYNNFSSHRTVIA